jgi:hypothetical protein
MGYYALGPSDQELFIEYKKELLKLIMKGIINGNNKI